MSNAKQKEQTGLGIDSYGMRLQSASARQKHVVFQYDITFIQLQKGPWQIIVVSLHPQQW